MITNSCPFPPLYFFLLFPLLLFTFLLTPFYFPPYSFLLSSLLLSTSLFTPFYFSLYFFLLPSFLLHLLAFEVQKLRKRHAKAKKMRGKSLAFANRLDKYLLLNGLQIEVRREVGRSKKGKSFP